VCGKENCFFGTMLTVQAKVTSMGARLPGNVNGRLCVVEAMCFERDEWQILHGVHETLFAAHSSQHPCCSAEALLSFFIATMDCSPSEVTVDTVNPLASYI
jgi:hypothetical protein